MADEKKSIRVNLNMSPKLLERIDDYAERSGLSRSSTIAMCCDGYLDQLEAFRAMPVMTDFISKITSLSELPKVKGDLQDGKNV